MKNIKFITTFSNNGYNVYGKTWVESFLNYTKDYNNISAKIYINDLDLSNLNYGSTVELVDFNDVIPSHKSWVERFQNESNHDSWNKDLAIKFSFKSFVMIDELKNNNKDIVIWLDADCVFTSSNFDSFPQDLIDNKFIAIQKESGSEHCESGIVIFDSTHVDKIKFVEYFESQYLDPGQYNSYGQFFDGFALYRSITNTNIDHVDLNDEYGINGIQSDPSCTFLNPKLSNRFKHNIGLAGKQNYQEWTQYSVVDPFFRLIPGNTITVQEALEKIMEENLRKNKEKIAALSARGHR